MKQTAHLNITDMNCASCVAHIQKGVKKMKGVEACEVNFAMESGSVVYDDAVTDEKAIIKTIKEVGYTARPLKHEIKRSEDRSGHEGMDHGEGEDHSAHAATEDGFQMRQRLYKLIVAAVLSAGVLVLAFFADAPNEREIMMALSLIILLYSGREFFTRGIPNLLKGRPQMDTLVALGVGAAFVYSSALVLFTDIHEEYFMDVAIITTFILLGRYLEARAKGRAGAAIRKLLQLSAKVAHRVGRGGKTQEVPLDQVQVGDRLLVKPGEKVPVDGVIVAGAATLNESMVTGESIPVDKKTGSPVIGATINGNTAFTMEAKKVGSETLLAHIIQLVARAQMSKAPIQKLVDLISGYFVWAVIGLAAVTFAVWSLGSAAGISQALIHTVAVLIIACPCALGLATPISIVVGSGKGASLGILIKKTESLEKVHKITAICFDKTGTITEGRPEVQVYKPLVRAGRKHLLGIAYALEAHSEHPLAASVVDFAKARIRVDGLKIKDFSAVTGLGVRGIFKGKHYLLGSSTYMEQRQVLTDAVQKEIRALQGRGHTVLALADDTRVLALFGVRDALKKRSAQAIGLLKKRGVRTVMLTGDNQQVASAIARKVGIDEVHAGVTPDKKSEIIHQLQNEGYFVAMAGDGINDSPALAQADVGIAMGTGTDIAMETGDLVLTKGDLLKAVEAIELSRATLRNIKQNLFWAFAYNTVGIPLAAFGFLTPAFSAGAMAFSSVSVVLNALRLKRFKVRL